MSDEPEAAGIIYAIPLTEILADEDFNCRGKIAPIDISDLAKNIKIRGLIQPVTVCKMEEKDGKKFRLLAGFRRYMAHRINEAPTIECVVKEEMSEAEARIFNLTENLQRENLTFMQEARAISRLKDLGIGEDHAAKELGKSRGWVQTRFMALSMPIEIQAEIDAGFINQTHLRELYSILLAQGKDDCFEAVRIIKEAKIKGQKVTVNPNAKKKNPHAKRVRKRPEIFEMMESIQDSIGNNIGTRCLAWTAGEISDLELHESLRIYGDKIDKIYRIPV